MNPKSRGPSHLPPPPPPPSFLSALAHPLGLTFFGPRPVIFVSTGPLRHTFLQAGGGLDIREGQCHRHFRGGEPSDLHFFGEGRGSKHKSTVERARNRLAAHDAEREALVNELEADSPANGLH